MMTTATAAQSAGISTVPSPTGGVDFDSPLYGMPPENAIRLVNWWTEVYGCTHRRGYAVWADDLPGNVGSIYTFHTRSGQSFLYAFAGAGMYDVTTKDTVSPPPARTPVVSGLTTSIWQATMFSNSAGTHKVLVSGQDDPIWVHQPTAPAVVYDRLVSGNGTDPGTIRGITGTSSSPTVIPVNPKDFIDVMIHQKRVWFVEKDTCNAWYLPPEQVYGDARKFDFGPLFKRGGFLQSLATWTVGGGEGTTDCLVAFGSEGDVAVYTGIDPDSADTWSLKGVFYAGALLQGHRFHTKVAGDLKFLTTQGLISMNNMFTSNVAAGPQSNVEAKPVQQFLSEQASQFGFLNGWDFKFVPSINMLIINIPSVVQDGSLQLVENVVNTKWSTFLGLDASCWCTDYQEVPFFARDNRVCQGWTGHTDEVSIDDPAGKPITALVQQAYNYFGTPANNKQIGLFRPNFLTDRRVVWKAAIGYNFKLDTVVLQINPPQPGIPLWDEAIWDQARWSGGLHTQMQWASAQGCGINASLIMATRSDGEVVWVTTDWTISSGGIL